MSGNKADYDINDVFESILLAEEQITKKAFDEGVSDGVGEGSVEAYHMGFHKGAKLGAELAQYYIIADEQLESHEDLNDKFVKQLKDLKDLIDAFPRTNDKEIDFDDKLDKIRALFKKITTNLKIAGKPNREENKLSF